MIVVISCLMTFTCKLWYAYISKYLEKIKVKIKTKSPSQPICNLLRPKPKISHKLGLGITCLKNRSFALLRAYVTENTLSTQT